MNIIESQTLEIINGNYHELDVVLTDRAGEPINLNGTSVVFTIKANPSDSEAILVKTVTNHVDANEGQTQFVLTVEDTDIKPGSYFYDVMVTTPEPKVVSIRYGRLRVLQRIG